MSQRCVVRGKDSLTTTTTPRPVDFIIMSHHSKYPWEGFPGILLLYGYAYAYACRMVLFGGYRVLCIAWDELHLVEDIGEQIVLLHEMVDSWVT